MSHQSVSFELCGPTQRAPDGWDSARFLSIFLALGFSRFDGESQPTPLPLTRAVNCHDICYTFLDWNHQKYG